MSFIKKPSSGAFKTWIFEYLFIVDTHRFDNQILNLCMLVLELGVIHYFYIHPAHTVLFDFSIFRTYFQLSSKIFVHLHAFQNTTLSILTLSIYPFVALLIILIKFFGSNQLLKIIIQLLTYVYPLIFIKIVIQLIQSVRMGFSLIALPLGFFSLLFGVLILVFQNKLYKMFQIPLILLLQFKVSSPIILVILSLRICLYFKLFYPEKPNILGALYQSGLLIVVFFCHFCTNQLLNYIGFLVICISSLALGASIVFEHKKKSKDIYDYLEQQDNQQSIFQIFRLIEEHYVRCLNPQCKCREFYDIKEEQLSEWAMNFEQQRLRLGETISQRVDYALKCCEKYDYKISGLMRVSVYKPNGIFQQYSVFKICSLYQTHMRKQDRNYRFGEPYFNVHEEVQKYKNKAMDILQKVRNFWNCITQFDGSTKFLQTILDISRAINSLRADFQYLDLRYDEEDSRQFRYIFQLFESLILNQPRLEDEQLIMPEPVLFMVSNGNKIINANNKFSSLVGLPLQEMIGSSYLNFVPDIYRNLHNDWVQEFIQKVRDYEEKSIPKPLSLNNIQIKLVEMNHKIIPRFHQGLEVFTVIKTLDEEDKIADSFVFLVEKSTFKIINTEASFFEIIKFKLTQRNCTLLKNLKLTQVFQSFSGSSITNPSRQTFLAPQFLEEFTTIKRKDRQKRARTLNISAKLRKKVEVDMLFEYQILPSNRKESPYTLVKFKLHNHHQKIQTQSYDSESVDSQTQLQIQQYKYEQKQQSKIDFCVPYYILIAFVVVHVLFIIPLMTYQEQIINLSSRYEFFLDFDYTILYKLGIFAGQNRLQSLKARWIQNFGSFSESFIAFSNSLQTTFSSYFIETVAVDIHNSINQQILTKTISLMSFLQIYNIGIMIVLLGVLGIILIDTFLSFKYMINIQKQVGVLLLQFVVINDQEVTQNLRIIHNFSIQVLNIKQKKNLIKNQTNDAEESCNPINKTAKNFLVQQQNLGFMQNDAINQNQNTALIRASKRKTSMRYSQKQRVSIQSIRNQLLKGQQNSEKSTSTISKNRSEAIITFQKKYQSYAFIICGNLKLFIMNILGSLLMIGACVTALFLLTAPFHQFHKHTEIMSNLYQSKIILLKSLEEIQIDRRLMPQRTLSQSFQMAILKVGDLTSGMAQFKNTFDMYLTADVCNITGYNCSVTSEKSLKTYGINIINQHVSEFLRTADKSELKVDSSQFTVINYQLFLIGKLIDMLKEQTDAYAKLYAMIELKIVICGSILLLIGLILSHCSLQQFKNRIEDSNNLLRIIPKQIRKKHENDILEMTAAM